MASKLKLKNNIETEFSITHKDNTPAKSIDTNDLTYTRATVADMEAISNPQDGDVCFVKDLDRGGSFIYDSSEVGNDNQGTNFNGWIRQYSGAVNVKWFGAKGDGITDDTGAIQNATDFSNIKIVDGVYFCKNIVLKNDLTMEDGAILLFSGSGSDFLIDLNSSNLKVNTIRVSGNYSYSQSLIKITGSNCEIDLISMQNVVAPIESSSVVGLTITGSNNKINKVLVKDFQNTGNSNGSMPQGIVATNASTNNRIDIIDSTNIQSCLVVFGDADLKVGLLNGDNLVDNLIYQLNGRLNVDNLFLKDGEEIVIKGQFSCGTITITGDAFYAFAIENSGKVDIGTIIINNANLASLFSTRSGNITSGQVNIGKLIGECTIKDNLINLGNGTVEYITIGYFNVKIHLKQVYAYTSFGSFVNFNGVKGFNIQSFNLTIIDDDDFYTGQIIYGKFYSTTNLSKVSYFNNHNVITYAGDESTTTSLYWRGIFAGKSTLINFNNCKINTLLGPYVLRSNDFSWAPNAGNISIISPVVGTWKKGTILHSSDPVASGNIGWVCTADGSPGTWKAFGTIEA